MRVALLIALLFLPSVALAQDRSCEDRVRELAILADHHQRGRQRDAAEASRALADLVKQLEALQAENAALRQKLAKPGGH